jgi:hypothetical protein
MSATGIVHDWRQGVAGLLCGFHAHQTNAVADLSLAVAVAGDCRAGHLAPHVRARGNPASARRRCERFLANDRINPRLAQRALARSVLTHWAGRTVLLILDETPRGEDLRAMCVRLGYARRAVPVAWECYRTHAPPRRMPHLIRGLLRQVRGCLPAGCEVVLLADRGLAWPVVVDFCHDSGWHYAVRLQGTTRIRFPDGTERPVRELVGRPGDRWVGPAEVFKKAGWRGAHLAGWWDRGMTEPWLILSDRPGVRHARVYAKRMWVEESFRDDKSSGLGWDRSRVAKPRHAGRLLLVLAVAMVLAVSLGADVLKSGRRRRIDPHPARRLSIVQLGLRWLRDALAHDLAHLLRVQRLYLYPT